MAVLTQRDAQILLVLLYVVRIARTSCPAYSAGHLFDPLHVTPLGRVQLVVHSLLMILRRVDEKQCPSCAYRDPVTMSAQTFSTRPTHAISGATLIFDSPHMPLTVAFLIFGSVRKNPSRFSYVRHRPSSDVGQIFNPVLVLLGDWTPRYFSKHLRVLAPLRDPISASPRFQWPL